MEELLPAIIICKANPDIANSDWTDFIDFSCCFNVKKKESDFIIVLESIPQLPLVFHTKVPIVLILVLVAGVRLQFGRFVGFGRFGRFWELKHPESSILYACSQAWLFS